MAESDLWASDITGLPILLKRGPKLSSTTQSGGGGLAEIFLLHLRSGIKVLELKFAGIRSYPRASCGKCGTLGYFLYGFVTRIPTLLCRLHGKYMASS